MRLITCVLVRLFVCVCVCVCVRARAKGRNLVFVCFRDDHVEENEGKQTCRSLLGALAIHLMVPLRRILLHTLILVPMSLLLLLLEFLQLLLLLPHQSFLLCLLLLQQLLPLLLRVLHLLQPSCQVRHVPR
jgi:hypothetical protein